MAADTPKKPIRLVPKHRVPPTLKPVIIRLEQDLVAEVGSFLFIDPAGNSVEVHKASDVLDFFDLDGDDDESHHVPGTGPDPPSSVEDAVANLDGSDGDLGGNGNGNADADEAVADILGEIEREEAGTGESDGPFRSRPPREGGGRRAFVYVQRGIASYAISALAVVALTCLTSLGNSSTAQEIEIVWHGPSGRVSGLLSALLAAGLVSRTRHPRTGRSYRWSVTPTGLRLVQKRGQLAQELVTRAMNTG
jgi:hypothetical protein